MGKGDRSGHASRPNHSFSFHGRGLDQERGYRSDSDQLEALLGTIRSRCPDDGRCVFSSGPEMATDAATAARALTNTTTSTMINSAAGSANGSVGTIEDQIRNVDKVLKVFTPFIDLIFKN